MIGGGDDGSSSIARGDDGCYSMGGGGTVGKISLSGEARGEMVSMLVEESSVGDEGDERCSSM
ncbi:hypothetical protein KI387_012839, partial [Taxus chinensis]